MQIRFNVAFAILILNFAAVPGFAACHAVTPSGAGSKNGSSWSNAYAGIPGTLTRGDVYYFADGTYGTSYDFSQAVSGTSIIEFRKAQSYDYGRGSDGCSSDISAGWNASTMGAAQATFQDFFGIDASYFLLNGNGTQTRPGCGKAPGTTVASSPPTPTDCGFVVKDLVGSSSGIIKIGSGAHDYTFKYVEWFGVGTPSANEDMFLFGAGDGSGPNTLIHIYGHNAGCVYVQDTNGTRNINNSYFWGTEVEGTNSDGCHGQFEFEFGGTNNGVEYNNVFQDIKGTANWTFASGSGTNTGWEFYNNVVWNSGASWSPTFSDGVWACINSGVNCNSFTIVQNDIVDVNSQSGINNENTGSYTIENNIWYGSATPAFNAGTGGTFTEDHNSYLVSGTSCPSGTANVCANTSGNPFTSISGANFALTSDNANWNNRASLSSPYMTDAAGNTFTTDRGAYQYVSGNAPSPPVGVTGGAVVVQ